MTLKRNGVGSPSMAGRASCVVDSERPATAPFPTENARLWTGTGSSGHAPSFRHAYFFILVASLGAQERSKHGQPSWRFAFRVRIQAIRRSKAVIVSSASTISMSTAAVRHSATFKTGARSKVNSLRLQGPLLT
jgi:hypothetical protein